MVWVGADETYLNAFLSVLFRFRTGLSQVPPLV